MFGLMSSLSWPPVICALHVPDTELWPETSTSTQDHKNFEEKKNSHATKGLEQEVHCIY